MESNHLDLDVNQADYHYLLGAFSGERGNRTPDTVLFRHMLYQLSYFTCWPSLTRRGGLNSVFTIGFSTNPLELPPRIELSYLVYKTSTSPFMFWKRLEILSNLLSADFVSISLSEFFLNPNLYVFIGHHHSGSQYHTNSLPIRGPSQNRTESIPHYKWGAPPFVR